MVIILDKEVNTENAAIVDIYGQGCNYSTGKGTEGIEVTFTVDIVSSAVSQTFTLIYQPMDRSDNMRAYSGFEMRPAHLYGHDGDQTPAIEKVLTPEGYEQLGKRLQADAEVAAEEWFNANYVE